MTDKAKIKKEVKIVLRALLLSAPMGLTAVELERDFREAEGYGVPFRELGYNSTSDLVEDLPDVASCHWEKGHAVFRGIADKTTKHIQSLVSKQNVDVRKCLKRRNALERQVVRSGRGGYSQSSGRGRSVSASSNRYQAPYSRPPQGRRTNSYSGGRSQAPAVPKSSPAYLRMQLKSLLGAHPNGILSTHFDSIFIRKCGFHIDYAQLGFTGLEDLVKSLSADISIERISEDKFRIYSRENFPKGSTELSTKPKAKPTSYATAVDNGSNKRSASQEITNPPSLMGEAHKSPVKRQASLKTSPLKSPGIPDARKSVPFQAPARAVGRARRLSSNRSDESTTRVGSSSSGSLTSPREPSPPANDLIDKQLCSEIQEVLESYPNGIFAASLPSEYKALTKKELPLISIGFYSVVELVSAIPDIVAIERQKKNSDWKLFDTRTFVPSKPPEEHKKKSQATPPKEPDSESLKTGKNNIMDVLLAHPTGVLLQELSAAYEKFHRTPLPVEDFGVSDVNSLVLAIPDTIKVVYKGQNQVYLHAQDQRLPISSGSLYSTIAKSIPQDAIGYGYSYSSVKKPKLNEYFPIYISTVYSPHKISIQLKDKENNLALESLMDELESVYFFPEGEKYLMPDAMVAVNQICCALYHEDNNWHRGLITGVPNLDLVEVYYVDYGTSLRIPKTSLRLLKSCFMKLPKQAIDARLAGIEPVGDNWTNDSRDRLLELSADKPLLALAVEEKTTEGVFDTNPFSEKSVLSLLLCDTSTTEDVHINDLLVSEGLARFTEQKKAVLPNSDSPAVPLTAEVSLQMLTGMGLPVPDDDPAQGFQWPEESSEVQEILGSGEGRFKDPLRGSSAGGQEMTSAAGDAQGVDEKEDDLASDTGPPPLQEEDDVIEKMAKELSEIEEEEDGGAQQKPWFITKVDLVSGQSLHLISFKDQGGQFVTSVEVSTLIWPTGQDENALFDMIELKAAQLGQVIVEELDSAELAESFASDGVPLSKSRPSKLQLFLLTSVAPLLMVSGQVSPALISHVQTLADEMPPLDDDDTSRESVSSETSAGVETDQDASDLQKMHDVLRTKRERILKDLMSNSGNVDVDEITFIEGLMKDIERRLEKTQSSKSSQGNASGSLGEISAQLAQTSLGSSISLAPTTPDNVFNSPTLPDHHSVFSPDQSAKDNLSQTMRSTAHQRHVSDRGVSQKQTAAISPLQRSSTGSMPNAQRGIGRGANMGKVNAGIGRGHQIKNIQGGQSLTGLNPNTPAFVPSPKRDGSLDGNIMGQMQKPGQGRGVYPFGNPQGTRPMAGGMPVVGRAGQNMMPGSFSEFNDLFKPIPLLPPNLPPGMPPNVPPPNMPPNMPLNMSTMPPMPSRTGAMGMNQLPPPNLTKSLPIPPPSFQTNPNPMPGLSLPPSFDMLPPPAMFDPNTPPPPFFGLGRGHQAWSINE